MIQTDTDRPSDDPSTGASPTPGPLSRRESLRRAAVLLAAGLGVPTTALASAPEGSSSAHAYRLELYDGEERSQPLVGIDLPEEALKVLLDEGAVRQIKIAYVEERADEPEVMATYDVRFVEGK